MKTLFKRAVVVFLLLVMVVNQVGSARALEQPAVSGETEQTDAPLPQRELIEKPPVPKMYDQPPAPKPAKIKLRLSASPKFISEDGQVTIHWQIADLPVGVSPILKINFPQGYDPVNVSGYNAEARTLSIPVSTSSGDFLVDVQGALDQAIFPATLLNGADVIASESLSLPKHEKFTAKRNGASLSAEKGRIKVSFDKKSLPEDAVVNVGVPAGDSVPPYSLSGHPFEIEAQGAQSGQDISQFAGEVSIDVDYSDFDLQGKNEQDLYLYYYDPATAGWYPLPTTVDSKTKTLHAITTHFTVFDTGLHDWEASHLPTVDNFQVSGFTGAATYSMAFEVPPGPGGLQPSLTLNYNSQVIDQSTTQTQPSWVGMGWSLGMNSIELNDHGTNESNTPSGWTSDDTWFINVNGISSSIVNNGNGFSTADENFMKLEFDSNANVWTVWDKQGNIYYFEEKAQMVKSSLMHCGPAYQPYRWMLTRVRNIFGKELTYTYVTETKSVKVKEWISTLGICRENNVYVDDVVTAIYPETITYPGGHYRVRFKLEARQDYQATWAADILYHNFERQRLQAIVVEQDHDGNGAFEKIVRKYKFEYASNSEAAWNNGTRAPIWSGVTWSMGGKTSTLLRVHQFGEDGVNELPTATFLYGDGMHLTRADNGYGGSVRFAYDQWAYTPQARDSQTFERNFKSGSDCTNNHFDGYAGGRTTCDHQGNGVDMLWVSGKAINTQFWGGAENAIRPGGLYKFSFDNIRLFGANTGFKYGFRLSSLEEVYNDPASGLVLLPTYASNTADVLLNVTGTTGAFFTEYAQMREVKIELLTMVYRVKSRTISNGSANETFTYTYTDGAVNDSDHSEHACPDSELEATPPTCQQYSEKYSEFRGHRQVTETAPDGRVTVTTYEQGDSLKGRATKVTVQDGSGKIFNEQIVTYKVTPLDLYPLSYNGLLFEDVLHNWIVTKSEENRLYKNDGSYEATKTVYGYRPTYGNLETKTEFFQNGTTWTTYRITNIEYVPNVDGVYLTGLPSRQYVTDAEGNFLAQTFNLYDNNTHWDLPPTGGKLKRVRAWAGALNYNQAFYTYDGWGNVTAKTAYSEYGASDADPAAESAVTQSTVFDPIYHTYPLEQYTPSLPGFPDGFVTKFDYDYTLGLPVSQTDPNGVVTRVRYDEFGRMVKLIKQGDGDLSPSLEIIYHDDASDLQVELRQKVDATHSYSIRHTYDGLGRKTMTETSSDQFATPAYSVVKYQNYISDGQRVTSQSAPDEDGNNMVYTTTRYDALGRPVSVSAPGGTVLTTYQYDGLTSSVTDPNGNTTKTIKDIVGRTEKIIPPAGPTITYNYDVAGQLTSVVRGGQTTSITYDKAGRKTEMDDPDMGHWYYKYNASGNLIAQVDAEKQAVNLYYDGLNRLKGKTYTTGPVEGGSYSPPADPGVYSVRYRYDSGENGIGRRTRMDDPTGFTTWAYDERGRVIEESKTIDGQTYVTSTTYNAADLPLTVKYPAPTESGRETITNTYNAQLLLEKVTSNMTDPVTLQPQAYIRNTEYDVAGRVTLRVLGNDNQSAYTYYAWSNQGGRLRLLQSGRDSEHSASLQNITYEYDPVGNIKTISDVVSAETQSFDYDKLDRLTKASVSTGASLLFSENYAYDPASGNLKTKAGMTLYYDDVNHAHAVTSTSGGGSYLYDKNGNQTRRTAGGQTYNLGYDVEGRLISVQKVATQAPATATVTPTNTATSTAVSPTSTPVPNSGTITFTSIGAEDGGVLESSATSEIGGSNDATTNTFNVGDDGVNRQSRGILSFDTSVLPDNATIQTATLRIKKWSQVGGDPLADSHLHVDIASAPGRFGTGYALQNMYFEATPGGDTIAYVPSGTTPDANGWFSTNLNPTGRSLISLTNKTQLRLRFGQADNGNNIADYIKFVSGNSTGGSPELIISYTSPAGTPSKTPIASPSGTVTATPTLTPTATSTPAPLTASNASFTYDGDGKMVKSIMDGVTTIIVSPIYQVKMNAGNSGPGVITKYYPGGAMRVGGALYYTLSDHLGSTSLTTDANGNKIAEMRYKPWGEVRYQTGDSHTDRTYTGQRSYSSDFGLMFYNARWYDPVIGRFAQADTIIPGGVQGYDRYAYVNNSPIMYADPTGHSADCSQAYGSAQAACEQSNQQAAQPLTPKNFLGRHLNDTEKKWIAAFIVGEISSGTDMGHYKWIIWGLLNKISWDVYQNKGFSVYGSMQMEEQGPLARFRVITGIPALNGDDLAAKEANGIEMLNDMVDRYETGRGFETNGTKLTALFQDTLQSVNDIENYWYTYGPNSSLDPTNGGVGHIKRPNPISDKGYAKDEGYATKKEALRVRNSYIYGPGTGGTIASFPYSFQRLKETKEGWIWVTEWRYIMMNTPKVWWP